MPKWMYNKDGGRLFEDQEAIPDDYVDCPTKVVLPSKNDESLTDEAPKKRGRKPKKAD